MRWEERGEEGKKRKKRKKRKKNFSSGWRNGPRSISTPLLDLMRMANSRKGEIEQGNDEKVSRSIRTVSLALCSSYCETEVLHSGSTWQEAQRFQFSKASIPHQSINNMTNSYPIRDWKVWEWSKRRRRSKWSFDKTLAPPTLTHEAV